MHETSAILVLMHETNAGPRSSRRSSGSGNGNGLKVASHGIESGLDGWEGGRALLAA